MVALLVIALAAVTVMAVLTTSTNRANAVFGQDGAGIDVLLSSELPLLLLGENGAYGMVVRHAMLRATAVVTLAVPVRAVAVVAVFTASGLRSNGADTIFWNDSLRIHRSTRLLVVVAVAVFRSAGVVGAVTAMASLRVAAVVAAWSLWLG